MQKNIIKSPAGILKSWLERKKCLTFGMSFISKKTHPMEIRIPVIHITGMYEETEAKLIPAMKLRPSQSNGMG
jgi:hypothetical protein